MRDRRILADLTEVALIISPRSPSGMRALADPPIYDAPMVSVAARHRPSLPTISKPKWSRQYGHYSPAEDRSPMGNRIADGDMRSRNCEEIATGYSSVRPLYGGCDPRAHRIVTFSNHSGKSSVSTVGNRRLWAPRGRPGARIEGVLAVQAGDVWFTGPPTSLQKTDSIIRTFRADNAGAGLPV